MSAYEPWRWRCPNGHTSWTSRDVHDGMHNHEAARTPYRCRRCGVEFDELRDAKENTWIGGVPG